MCVSIAAQGLVLIQAGAIASSPYIKKTLSICQIYTKALVVLALSASRYVVLVLTKLKIAGIDK